MPRSLLRFSFSLNTAPFCFLVSGWEPSFSPDLLDPVDTVLLLTVNSFESTFAGGIEYLTGAAAISDFASVSKRGGGETRSPSSSVDCSSWAS